MSKHFGSVVSVVLFGISMSCHSASGQEGAVKPSTKFSLSLVTELFRNEAYRGQAFYLDHLFVGKSNNDGLGHRIEIYNKDGSRLIQTLKIPHTPNKIYPFGQNSLIVAGKSYSGQWLTHYSIIIPTDSNNMDGAQFRVTTHNFPLQNMIEEVAGTHEDSFFGEPGEQAIYRSQGARGMSPFASKVSGPGKMVLSGHELWAIEGRNGGLGDENVIEFDTNSGERTDVFTERLGAGITDIIALADGETIAVNEAVTGKVTLIDRKTRRELNSTAVAQDVRGLAQYGHCILAVSGLSQAIDFVDIKDRAAPVRFAQWDLRNGGAGERLRRPYDIQLDADTGRIFVRSSWPCPSCNPHSQSSVMTVFDTEGSVMGRCKS